MEADEVRVITFNTAGGNRRITTPQERFLELPFYRETLAGAPEAAILALQEVGPAQARALERQAGPDGAHVLQTRRPGLGNALVIPRRYEVLSSRRRYYVLGQLRGIVGALRGWVARRQRVDWRQLGELRMWIEARLRDRSSGQTFTVLNTHLSPEPSLKGPQTRTIVRRAHRAAAGGAVVLAGDLNLRAADTRPRDAEVAALVATLRDMGTATPRGRPNVDYVLALGLEPVSSRIWSGRALRLAGHPDAESISDHYAEDDVLRFASERAGSGRALRR